MYNEFKDYGIKEIFTQKQYKFHFIVEYLQKEKEWNWYYRQLQQVVW